MMDRIMIQVSNIVTDEVAKKTEALRGARDIALKIMAMDRHDWMRIQDVSRLFGVNEKDVISKISRLNVPYMDIFGVVRKDNSPFQVSIPFYPVALNKDAIILIAQTFDSEKGQALREYTAQAMIHTMHKISKI
jgi:hypothetical protein